MKYYILFFSFLFATNITFSQVNLGIIAESGKGSLIYDPVHDTRIVENYYSNPGLNWIAGVYAEYYTPSGFHVQLNVVYNQINYSGGLQIIGMRDNYLVRHIDDRHEVKVECITLPLTFGYKFKNFTFGIGGQYSLFYRKSSFYGRYGTNTPQMEGFSSTPWKYYNYDLGLTSFISYKFFDRISVETRFNRGLRNLFNEYVGSSETIFSQQFLIGVKCDIVQFKRKTGKSINCNRKQKQLIGSRIIEKKQMFEEEEEEF